MAKALYFDVLQYTPENLRLLRSAFEVTELPNPAQCSDAVLKDVEVLFAPLGYRFDDDFMKRAPKLRVIATNTTSVPHVDVAAARVRHVAVVSLAGDTEFLQTITPTAEMTLGLMICLTRNIVPAIAAVKTGTWRRWDHGGERMLSKMHLGIVGFGRLGRLVARYAGTIGMRVHYYDPNVAEEMRGADRSASLEALVAGADIVSVHASVNESNAAMFDSRIFSHFRRGAYFINTARGELVDSVALVRALESGQVAGAALDVLDNEFAPDFQEHMLEHPLVRYARTHGNLLLTPHIGGSTRDAWAMTQRRTIERAAELVRP
jgi:phosphoglycerate dehydrogenase-like enzyme